MSQPSIDAAVSRIAVQVNGDSLALPGGCSVAALVRQLGLEGRKVAVAVNREVVPRSHFEECRLAEGDRVEILEAVGGG